MDPEQQRNENVLGYINTPFGTRIHLTPLFWEQHSVGRAQVLIHELGRLYADNLAKDIGGDVDDAYLFSSMMISIFERLAAPQQQFIHDPRWGAH